jgi:hypothetical protein
MSLLGLGGVAGCVSEDDLADSPSASSRYSVATPPYWENLANQSAAAAEGMVTVSVDDGSGRVRVVPKPRHDALVALRMQLGAEPELPVAFLKQGPTVNKSVPPPPVLLAEWMPTGDLSSLFYFGPDSLIDCVNDCGLATKQFIVNNKDLFGFAGSDLASPAQLVSLVQDSVRTSTSASGKKVTVVKLAQTYRGLPVFDGKVTAVFWDNKLVSLIGSVFNSAKDYHALTPSLTSSLAAAAASKAVNQTTGPAPSCSPMSQPKHGRIVWNCFVRRRQVLVSDKDPKVAYVEPLFMEAVIPSDGYRVSWCSNGDPYCPTANVLRDEYPEDYPWTYVSLNGDVVHPYCAGEVAVYNGRYNWSGAIGFDYKRVSWPDPYAFISYEDATSFASTYAMQHVSYWMQMTSVLAGDGHLEWPPRGSPLGNHEIVVVVNDTDPFNTDDPGYTQRACNLPGNPRNFWYAAHEAKPCVILNGEYPLPGSGSDADCAYRWDGTSQKACVWVNTILFHEFGHAQQDLYCEEMYDECIGHGYPYQSPCQVDTHQETLALNEAIAGLNSIITMLYLYGPSTAHSDYDADQWSLNRILYANIAGANLPVHHDSSTWKCHAYDYPDCTNIYWYGHAFLQAAWEFAHRINCGSGTCVALEDVNMVNWTKGFLSRSMYYALNAHKYGETFREFVGGMLTYVFYEVDYTVWNNSWWIFHHHGLVGGFNCACKYDC